jgi:hypothetical protein
MPPGSGHSFFERGIGRRLSLLTEKALEQSSDAFNERWQVYGDVTPIG